MVDDCDNITFYAPTGQLGKVPDPIACPPETILPIPDELREPAGAPQSEEPVPTPRPISVGNRKTTVNCDTENGEIGESVTIDAYTYTDSFPFSSVLSIGDDVLTYIAVHGLEYQIAEGVHNGTLTAQELSELTGMSLADAEEFLRLIYLKQAKLDNSAELAGLAQLACYWINDEVTVTCDDPSMARPADAPEAIYSATIPAGQYRSYTSKDDANAQARNAATSMLNCFYISDEYVAKCETRPDRPSENLAPVPNDVSPIYPGLIPRRGTVRVPRGMFTSTYSKEAANYQAQAYGWSLLVCYYPNDAVTVECDDPNARPLNKDPWDTEPETADPDKGIRGQRAVIPSGFVISDMSSEIATDEARLLAESLLECCFISAARTVTCASETITDSYGEEVEIPADKDASEVYTYTLPRGTYTSCISQEDADMKAELAMIGMLQCKYCNRMVLPTCVPSWVIDGVLAGGISLPLRGNVIRWGSHSIAMRDLPPEATTGAPDRYVCTENAQQSQNVADASARVPTAGSDSDLGCTYYSDMVVVGCAVSDPFGNAASGQIGVTSDGEPYYFYSMYPAGICISATQSNPAPGEYVIVPAGFFAGAGEESKAESNRKAIEFARTLVLCVWENPETIGGCGYTRSASSLCDSTWTVGRGERYDNQITPWSNGPDNAIILARGTVSYIGGTETTAFNSISEQVVRIILSMTVCNYYNDEQTGTCQTSGSTRANTAVVPRGTIVADSPTTANTMAKSLANAMAACYTPSAGGTGAVGPAGPAGPQGRDGPGCSNSSCSGVYS